MKFLASLLLLATSAVSFANTTLCGSYGCPSGAATSNDVVHREIYVLSNNRTTKFADWVAYKVTPDTIDGPSRSRYWKSDPAINSAYTLEASDYTSAWATINTDRGHQVPLASFSNTDFWRDTNYLSNITPQSSALNQGPWVRLESAVRDYVRTGQEVYVITGPLYEYYFAELPEADENHVIPSGYFKVVVTISNSNWVEASAFIMEQTSPRSLNYCTTETTVNEVESRTGLNFLPSMPWYKESAVETALGGLSTELGC